MTMNATDRPALQRWRSRYLGPWRALAAVPAIIGSFLLLLVLFGGMGPRWEGLVLLGWPAFGADLYTRGGERVAVRVGCGFHRPTAAQAAILSSPWSAALRHSQLTPHDLQLYLRGAPEANAYAAGTRSVAPTGLLTEFQAHRLAEDYLEAVLPHELGHRASRATRFALVTAWLAAPWRIATRLTISIVLSALSRQPRRPLAAVAAAGVIVWPSCWPASSGTG